jgi:hypothetical protein
MVTYSMFGAAGLAVCPVSNLFKLRGFWSVALAWVLVLEDVVVIATDVVLLLVLVRFFVVTQVVVFILRLVIVGDLIISSRR